MRKRFEVEFDSAATDQEVEHSHKTRSSPKVVKAEVHSTGRKELNQLLKQFHSYTVNVESGL